MASESAPSIAVSTAADIESKSSKKSKTSSVKTPAVHPTYLQMSSEAIFSLKERTGSSTYAIAKWMEQKYNGLLPANFKKHLHLQLKNQTQKGKLIQIKNSYKLSDELRKSVKKNIDLNTDRKKSEASKMSSGNASRTTIILKKVRSVNKLVTKPLNSKATDKMSSKRKITALVCKEPASKSLNKLCKFSTKVPERDDVKVSIKAANKVDKTLTKDSLSKNLKPLTIKPGSNIAKTGTAKSTTKVPKPASSAKNKPVASKRPSVAKKPVTSKPLVPKNKLVKKVNTSKPFVPKNKLVKKVNTSKPLVKNNNLVNAASV